MLRLKGASHITGLLLLAFFFLTSQEPVPADTHTSACGDINCDGEGPDIGDLTALISYLYIPPTSLPR